MDYSIGSISDLVTGNKTPNKQKVVTKTVKSPQVLPQKNVSSLEKQNSSPAINSKKRRRQRKTSSKITENQNKSPVKTTNENQKKSPQKRKLETNQKAVSPKKIKKESNDENENGVKVNEDDPEVQARTIFVGNIPVTANKKQILKFFSKYGDVETVRIRGVPVAHPKTPKKVALIKKEFHPSRQSFFAFVRFKERASAVKATQANGTLFNKHHLIVQLRDDNEKPDENKAIFVGNLSFQAEEDDLWKAFEACGPIASVRIVRDGKTRMGKGFGYVNFKNSDSVTLALEMDNVMIKNRELRIKACNLNSAKKVKKEIKLKSEKAEPTDGEKSPTKKDGKSFQGVKFVAKKKNKVNKGLLQKKIKSKKIAPK